MASSEEAVALLRSIDGSLKQLVQVLAATAPKPVADDRDLDGQYGNPEVKFNPRDWTGPSYKGRPMSDCDPKFLEMLAETFDYFAAQAEEKDEKTSSGKPVAPYKRKDAMRARGWAKRIREGTHTPATAPVDDAWAGPSTDEWSSGI